MAKVLPPDTVQHGRPGSHQVRHGQVKPSPRASRVARPPLDDREITLSIPLMAGIGHRGSLHSLDGEGEQVATCLLRSLGKQVPTCLLVSLSTQVHPLADKSQQARPLGQRNSVRAGTYLRAERSQQAGSHVLAERSRQAGPHVLAKRPPRAGDSCSLRSQYAGGYLPAKICREAAGANNRRHIRVEKTLVGGQNACLPPHALPCMPHTMCTPTIGVHMASRRAGLPDRRAEPARLSGRRAKPARPLDRRAGFARLWAHVSLSNREAYVSRGTLIRVLRTLIAGLTSASRFERLT
ncbi:hypothetical protein PCANC_27218 [Puccinia coronata f. sp. avenae]|uniref:Uncharacterized protein n=1 Tax=Puccinia coronata f. sp. avenae TaxID=200324 RepID=A0A2N5TL35_9BASI|nr:hypothetical protein PCANC_27218 [Puccinia coronata f. sp. avenae]